LVATRVEQPTSSETRMTLTQGNLRPCTPELHGGREVDPLSHRHAEAPGPLSVLQAFLCSFITLFHFVSFVV
jgi:hypothetical protein